MKRVENVACGSVWSRLGGVLLAMVAAGAIVACNSGGGSDEGGGPIGPGTAQGADAGATPPGVTITSIDGGVVHPAPHSGDAGAPHHPPPPANDAGAHQTDGGTKPATDAGSTTTPTADGGAGGPSGSSGDDASTPSTDDAGSATTGSGSSSSGSSSSAACITGDDCFSIPCGCSDGTIEFWQACGADGTCLGYGVCLNDQVCANNGGLADPTAPPVACDSSDPTACAPVTCSCNDGTVLDYQACEGTSCATTASCGADGDDVCNAHDGWVGDAPTPPPAPCPDQVCSCPDGVVYAVPDERCLGSDVCATDLVCSGD